MIKTFRRTFSVIGIGRKIAHRCVVVSLALSGFLLHYSHGRPINVEFPSTKLTGLTRRKLFDDSTGKKYTFADLDEWLRHGVRFSPSHLMPGVTRLLSRERNQSSPASVGLIKSQDHPARAARQPHAHAAPQGTRFRGRVRASRLGQRRQLLHRYELGASLPQ